MNIQTTEISGQGVAQLLRLALQHHQSGRLAEAEALYRQILGMQPNHADALHLSGLIAHQRRQSGIAVMLIGKAIEANPLNPIYHSNLGLALKAQGKLDEAIRSYREAMSIKADIAEVHYNLGVAYHEQGNPGEALAGYRRALALKPDYAEAYCKLGNALQVQGNLDEAITSYRKALALKPGNIEALSNLASALHRQGKLDEAISCLHSVLEARPDMAEAHNNLGILLSKQGKLDQAIKSFSKALELKPDYAEAHNNLGIAYREQGRLGEAIASYRQALAIRPDYAEAHNYLGVVLGNLGKSAEAVESLRRAISLKPDYAEAYSNLGAALRNQGKLDEALENFRKALLLKPDYAEAYSNMLFTMSYHPQYPPAEYLAEVRRYGNMIGAQAKPYSRWRVSSDGGDTHSLRVGLVSGDLRTHPVSYFLEGIIANSNPARVELVAYVTNTQEDAITARIRPHFAAWHLITGLSDEAVARKIHDDGIQVLIDLAGHTANNRLPVFAWRPAPVQVSWLGYWASTGVPGMDYLLADRISVPEQHQGQFTETIWYLPVTRLCFTPPADSAKFPLSSLPMARNSYITFGSFQNLSKINDKVLALWSRVLDALPDARLKLQNIQMNCPVTSKQFGIRLARLGIAPERVMIERGVSREDYLAAYADVDIILDTFPFPGGTTTCEALWMGVPTLTLAGDTLLGRQGASMLACVDLEDWVASDEEDYAAKAVFHVSDVGRLAELRAELRQRVLASPLFDGTRFAGDLENALHGMWQQRTRLDPNMNGSCSFILEERINGAVASGSREAG